MAEWSLPKIFASLHNQIENELKIGRAALNHPTNKGDAAEAVWLEMLSLYLPKRYRVAKAHVVDSNGKFSQQIDVVVFDRQYSPFIFNFKGSTLVPAESIYAVFEVKPKIDSKAIRYAQEKINSVRVLHRTSLPIPNAGGKPYEPKTPFPILGGLLTFGSGWKKPPLGDKLISNLIIDRPGRLDLGCVASHGLFSNDAEGNYTISLQPKAATAFLFELIARLQTMATVPMIDVRAYARWLT
jgi:hypothetical protein